MGQRTGPAPVPRRRVIFAPMSVLKKLAGETALYGLSSIVGRSVNFLLVPLYTSVFRPGEQGVIIELFSWVALFNVLYTFGMETSYFRFATRTPERKTEYFNLTTSTILTISLLVSGLLILFADPIMAWREYPGQERLLVWMAIIMALDAVATIPFARLRLEKKAKRFVTIRLINIGLNVGLNVFFLIFCRDIFLGKYFGSLQPLVQRFYDPTLGVGYIVLANLIANAFTLLQLLPQLREFRYRLDWALLRPLLLYAYPILIMGFAGIANQNVDRIMLRELLPDGFYPGRTSADALGIYGNVYKLAILMNLAIQSFRFAADPFFFSKAEDKAAPAVFALVMKWFVIACTVLWVGVSLNLDVLGVLTMRQPIYREGLGVVPYLLLGNLFLGVYYNLSVWFKLSDKTAYGTLITAVGAVLTVAGNVLLIPRLGYTGCAVTFLVSCFVMMVLCYALGEKFYPIPYDVRSAVGYVAAAGLLIWLSSLVEIPNLWVAVPFHLALCGLFVSGIAWVERDSLRPRRAKPVNG